MGCVGSVYNLVMEYVGLGLGQVSAAALEEMQTRWDRQCDSEKSDQPNA